MQENDFEKQVHQKMEELRLQPSDAVWRKVEEQVRRKEKRRRWMVWVPLGMLLAAGGGYLMLHPLSLNHKRQPSPITEQVDTGTPGIPGPQIASGKMVPHQDGPRSNAHSPHPVSPEPILPPVHGNKPGVPAAKSQPAGPYSRHDERLNPAGTEPSVSRKDIAYTEAAVPVAVQDQDPERVATVPDIRRELHPAVITGDVIAGAPINTSLGLADYPVPGSGIPVRRHRHNSAWEWKLSVEGGRSWVNNGRLTSLFASSAVADMGANFGSAGNPGTGGLFYQPPASQQPGTGMSAGFAAGEAISSRLSWSAGLQYTQYSTRIAVGSKVNGSFSLPQNTAPGSRMLSEFYQAGTGHTYTNRFHFVELPLILEARVTRSRTLPVYWNAGMSLSRLLSANVLHYNSSARIYYQDKQLVNRTQFNVITGLDMRLFSSRQFPVLVGPRLRYGVNSLLTKEAAGNKHLLLLSFKAAVILQKKK